MNVFQAVSSLLISFLKVNLQPLCISSFLFHSFVFAAISVICVSDGSAPLDQTNLDSAGPIKRTHHFLGESLIPMITDNSPLPGLDANDFSV